MYSTDPYQEEGHIATGSESLREFAFNAGMDHPERCWLLDSRDVWVRNPFYRGTDVRHPEDDDGSPEMPPELMTSAAVECEMAQFGADDIPF